MDTSNAYMNATVPRHRLDMVERAVRRAGLCPVRVTRAVRVCAVLAIHLVAVDCAGREIKLSVRDSWYGEPRGVERYAEEIAAQR